MDNITILDYHAIWYICTQMLNFQHVFDQIPNWKSLLRKRQNCNWLKGDDGCFWWYCLLLMLIIIFKMPSDVTLWHPGNIGTTDASLDTHATASPTQTESYKKTKGLDYPVNVARWALGIYMVCKNAFFSSGMWPDWLFPRILCSHPILSSIQGEIRLVLKMDNSCCSVLKSNSGNNVSARTSSPHFWIWLEEMGPS